MRNEVNTNGVQVPEESFYFFCERQCFLDQERKLGMLAKSIGFFRFFKSLLNRSYPINVLKIYVRYVATFSTDQI